MCVAYPVEGLQLAKVFASGSVIEFRVILVRAEPGTISLAFFCLSMSHEAALFSHTGRVSSLRFKHAEMGRCSGDCSAICFNWKMPLVAADPCCSMIWLNVHKRRLVDNKTMHWTLIQDRIARPYRGSKSGRGKDYSPSEFMKLENGSPRYSPKESSHRRRQPQKYGEVALRKTRRLCR